MPGLNYGNILVIGNQQARINYVIEVKAAFL